MKEKCLICHMDIDQGMNFFDWLKGNQLICGICHNNFVKFDTDIKFNNLKIHILYYYQSDIENLIYQFKECRDIALAPVFFYDFKRFIHHKYRKYTLVLMPSHPDKIKERTFHHMEEMLKGIDLPIIDPFYKNKNHKQSLQDKSHRSKINEIIKLKKDFIFPSTPLLLIDDVITTGSTLNCAYNLIKEHMLKIEVFVLCAHSIFIDEHNNRLR